jgi:hypothetical protein
VAVSYWVDYGMSFVDGSAQWRFPISLQILFAVSTILLLLVLPESPRWLLYHDRQDTAVKVLERVNFHEAPGTAEREALEIATAIADEKRAGAERRYVHVAHANTQRRPSRLIWYIHFPVASWLSSPTANSDSSTAVLLVLLS